MLETLATRPDPLLFLIAGFPLSLAALALGYTLTVRYSRDGDEKAEAAFGLGQAAIFGLIALILGFSFSFAAERFEARRALIVNEADAVGTTYLRADFLPAAQQDRFRRILLEYTRTRLETYASVSNARAEALSIERGKVLQAQLWQIALGEARSDPRNNLYSALTSSINEMIDVSEQQVAALNNHVPIAILGFVLLCTIAGAGLLGVTFGRARSPNVILSVIFCVLFAATVFTIVDLDQAQGGFIGLDLRPLQATLDDMKP